MLDALGGSADLINLRSRGTYQRPFTRVDDLERQLAVACANNRMHWQKPCRRIQKAEFHS
ncbi:MAG: hypothetical protein R3E67_05915 [Pseudomonadales bacterium]